MDGYPAIHPSIHLLPEHHNKSYAAYHLLCGWMNGWLEGGIVVKIGFEGMDDEIKMDVR